MIRTIAIALLVFFSGCANVPAPALKAGDQGLSTAQLMVVDCLLPGQVRKLGQNMSFLAPRRAVKTSAVDCEIRGGEYVAFDRANYATALKIWLPQAKQGDSAAQTYVGEIYEKGLGVSADYGLALYWYQQAAEQGYSRAQINLGYLYEGGLGVPRDPVTAMNWYRRASGLNSAELEYVSAMEFARRESVQKESEQLKEEVKSLHTQLEQTRTRLEKRKVTLAKAERGLLNLQQELESHKRKTDNTQSKTTSGTDFRAIQMEVQLKLSQRLRETQQEQQRLTTKLASEQLKSGELASQLQQYKQQIGTRKQELASSHQELEQARRQLQGLEASADKGRHTAEIQGLTGKTKTLVALVATQQKEISALEAERDDQAQLAQEKLALKQDLESRNQEIASLKTALVEQKERLKSMQAMQDELIDLQQDQQQLTTKLSTQQLAAQDLRKELDETRGQLFQRKDDLKSSKMALEQTKTELEQAKQVGSTSQKSGQELTALQTKQRDLQAMIKTQQQEASWLEQEMKAQQQTLTKQLQEAQRGEEQLTRTLQERDQDISSLRQQLAVTQKQLQRGSLAQGQVQELEKELQSRQAEIDQQKQAIAGLQRDLSQQTSRLGGADVTAVVATATVGPSIELIDPPLSVTRGIPSINLRSAISQVDIIGRVTSSQELYSFRVNDQDQVIETGGLFRAKMTVKTPNTPVSLVAIDKHGKRAAVDFLIVPQSGEDKPQQQPASTKKAAYARNINFGNYHALIIGNNNYQHFTNLSTAVNDARAVDRMLRDNYGFKTKLLIDADRYAMLSALNEMREQLTDEDNLLIYYAGHGELDNVNLRGYWLPVDAEADSSTNWISNVAITDILNVMAAKHVLVVADSCYSGSMTRSSLARLSPGMSEQARQRWLKVMAKTRARAALTSGGVKPVLDSGAGGDHSIFAQAFLDVLGENDAILEGFSLYREVQRRVKLLAATLRVDQDPQYAPIKYAGHEAGEFFLLPRGVKVGRWSPENGSLRIAKAKSYFSAVTAQ